MERLALTAREVGQLLGCSERHIRRMRSAGKLPRPVKIGGAVRYKRNDIEKWLELGCPDLKTFEELSK